MPLSDTKIRNAKACKTRLKLTDGNGLYLVVTPKGSKLWRYRYRISGKENVFALGEYPSIGLSEARTQRSAARELVKQGIHPSHHRRKARVAHLAENANTFEAVALEWLEKKKSSWTPSYARQVERFLSADVFRYVGTLPIRTVTAAQLLEIVRRVEARGAETVALLLRQWTSAIFRYAVATLRADQDPAAALRGAIHRPKTRHHKPLSRDQIGKVLQALQKYAGAPTTIIAMRLMLLTFVRTKELREAEWCEFDFDRSEWRIPAERMKKRQQHIVPLSRQSLELLHELFTHTGNQRLLFPNFRNPSVCMTATTLNRALERMGFNGKGTAGFSMHGFRATASTILNELGFRPDVIERQLAHVERNKTRASYNQAEYLEERRLMMQEWADLVDDANGARVIPIGHASRFKAE